MNHLGFSIISITNFCSWACVNTGQNLLLSDSDVSLYYIIFFTTYDPNTNFLALGFIFLIRPSIFWSLNHNLLVTMLLERVVKLGLNSHIIKWQIINSELCI